VRRRSAKHGLTDRPRKTSHVVEDTGLADAFSPLRKVEDTHVPVTTRRVKPAFNGLSTRDWTLLSRNVWNDVSSPRDPHHLEHGAVFPVKLASRLISLYSAEGDLVFDPFVGVGSTCVAAYQLRRPSVGIELSGRFVKIAQRWVDEISGLFSEEALRPLIHRADCRDMEDLVGADSIQVTVTSPPYADFIHKSVKDRAKTHKKSAFVLDNNSHAKVYSSHESDFGNFSYDDFLSECRELLGKLLRCTRPGGYAAWIVKDARDLPHAPYVPLHADLGYAAREAGWKWHDLIIWDQNEQRRLVLLGYPSKFYTNPNCSFIVILRKNDR
jgi:DNA modification methylase